MPTVTACTQRSKTSSVLWESMYCCYHHYHTIYRSTWKLQKTRIKIARNSTEQGCGMITVWIEVRLAKMRQASGGGLHVGSESGTGALLVKNNALSAWLPTTWNSAAVGWSSMNMSPSKNRCFDFGKNKENPSEVQCTCESPDQYAACMHFKQGRGLHANQHHSDRVRE